MSCEHLLEQFKTKLQTEGLRDQTIRSYIADAQQYCKWLLDSCDFIISLRL